MLLKCSTELDDTQTDPFILSTELTGKTTANLLATPPLLFFELKNKFLPDFCLPVVRPLLAWRCWPLEDFCCIFRSKEGWNMKCMMCENVKSHCKEEAIPEWCNAVFRPSKSNIFEVAISARMNAPVRLTSCSNDLI